VTSPLTRNGLRERHDIDGCPGDFWSVRSGRIFNLADRLHNVDSAGTFADRDLRQMAASRLGVK
jgi:hypothetical protein